ncbi:MAG: BamA/TamA family outer membrane protein [Ignavibacteriaceae bacterium]|nr:BamA/TamA family outer membrane protein [Ignavibacteria bacterium]NNL22413.1 BamA/TamA family outer membrane protein [Ignavibacteriaceae bacterium]
MKIFSYINLVILLSAFSIAQNDYKKEYVTLVPNEKYGAGGFHKFLFGEHWRDVWTTPIKVEVLDLKKFAGGLVPLKKGGGMQTKSLRFKSSDGRIWKFRSLDKDPSKILPPELQETVAEDIVQDQISSANPMAPFVVQPLLEAVYVLSAEPFLVYMPNSKLLGEFKEEFGGMLGIIEVHPDEPDKEGEPGFEEALKVKGTYKLLNHLEYKRKQKIDSEEYLKARLMDILLGDWDRHMDQWRWAEYENEEGKLWYPIPRDRDQVFSKYDGVFPYFAAYLIPQLNHFGYDYPQIEDLTWNGRFLDRRVLTGLDKNSWDSVTTFVQNKITHNLIEFAATKLPPEIYPLCAPEIIEKLKSRRDKLQKASEEFYNLVNKYAEIYCSAENDFVEVNRIDDSSTEVIVYRRDKDSGRKKKDPLFHKIFRNEITLDIRIFMNDGDDKAVVTGECDISPVLKIVGGHGKDEIVDSSIVHGYFLTITPIPIVQRRTYFYDSGNKTKVIEGPGTVYDDYKWPDPKNDLEKFEPQQIDRGHNWLPVPIFGLDTDYGLTLGGGIALHSYDFRAVPKDYTQQLTVSYATRFGNFAAGYEGNFYSLIRNSKLRVLLAFSEQFVTRYFGYGNNTEFNADLESNNFYQVDQRLLTLYPTIYYNFSKRFSVNLGISFIQTKTSLVNDTLLSEFRHGTYGLGTLNPLGIHLGLEIEGRENINLPQNGYLLKLNSSFFPAVDNVPENFYRTSFDVRTYFTPEFISVATLALRAGGTKVWGKYPFFAGATIGGKDNVRGYNDKRFTGDASLFGQVELRLFIAEITLILKSKLGVDLFVEAGRVFTPNDSLNKWHPSYGAGIWLDYFHSEIIPTAYVAFSPDRTTFAFGLGMGF